MYALARQGLRGLGQADQCSQEFWSSQPKDEAGNYACDPFWSAMNCGCSDGYGRFIGPTLNRPTAGCPQDAKVCANGVVLQRTGPGCQFPACPLSEAELARQQDLARQQLRQQDLAPGRPGAPGASPSAAVAQFFSDYGIWIGAGILGLAVAGQIGRRR